MITSGYMPVSPRQIYCLLIIDGFIIDYYSDWRQTMVDFLKITLTIILSSDWLKLLINLIAR
jgi:hypothetical protein